MRLFMITYLTSRGAKGND